jgi:ubiquinone biosynthesis monooxygenase Coq7
LPALLSFIPDPHLKIPMPGPSIDELINAFDHGLRTLAGVRHESRPSPAAEVPDGELSSQEKSEAAALMRVNHSGEICAQALYQGQALASADSALKQKLARAAQEELDHLAWSQARIDELGGRTSLLNPLWYAGSFAIGYGAGKLGDKFNLGFLAETERQVERHLQGHLERLSPQDDRTRAVINVMAREEAGHAAMANTLGGKALPQPVKLGMQLASRVMTRLSYWI